MLAQICHHLVSLAHSLVFGRCSWVVTGARPTNDISIECEIRPKFAVLSFKIFSTDHNKILPTPRQRNCRDVCKISLWLVKHILMLSFPNFDRISNLIEIVLVGRAPGLQNTWWKILLPTA